MKCHHTGLPRNMCGHCNGTNALVPEPFRGKAPGDKRGETVSDGRMGTLASGYAVQETSRGRFTNVRGQTRDGVLTAARPFKSAWRTMNEIRSHQDYAGK